MGQLRPVENLLPILGGMGPVAPSLLMRLPCKALVLLMPVGQQTLQVGEEVEDVLLFTTLRQLFLWIISTLLVVGQELVRPVPGQFITETRMSSTVHLKSKTEDSILILE